jgi:hypothetical protein
MQITFGFFVAKAIHGFRIPRCFEGEVVSALVETHSTALAEHFGVWRISRDPQR